MVILINVRYNELIAYQKEEFKSRLVICIIKSGHCQIDVVKAIGIDHSTVLVRFSVIC